MSEVTVLAITVEPGKNVWHIYCSDVDRMMRQVQVVERPPVLAMLMFPAIRAIGRLCDALVEREEQRSMAR